MKFGVVVFNWNYGEYLKVLLDKISYFYNDEGYEIHICDDGSSDESIAICQSYLKKNKINNLFIHGKEYKNTGRDKPYLGQLENLESLYRDKLLDRCDYIWLMDADDYMESSDFDSNFKREVGDVDVAFTNVINKGDDFHEKMKITRKANEDINIWPTISVTSSIIISMEFLVTYEDIIFSYDKRYDDVWLDSRINMIASRLKNNKVRYIDYNVYRLIHGGNDSSNMPLMRRLEKQVKSNNYFSLVCGGDKPFNIRTKLLDMFFSR